MNRVKAFSLEKHEGPYEKWPRLTRLYFNGCDTGKKIPGYVIEGQYQGDAGYLLITSQDCMFEESNDFLLLDKDFNVIAQERLLTLYDSYLLVEHWPISSIGVRLHYQERLFFTLMIEEEETVTSRRYTLKLQKYDDYLNDSKALNSIKDYEQRIEAIKISLANSNDTST